MKMTAKMKNGKPVVFLYNGVIPKSGKAIIEFGGIKLCHRSIRADKSDLLVHVDTKIIVRSYPIKTDRGIVLDDIANNIDKLKHFIEAPEAYLLEERVKLSKKEEDVSNTPSNADKKPSYSRAGNYAHLNDDNPSCVTGCGRKEKKRFNVGEAKW